MEAVVARHDHVDSKAFVSQAGLWSTAKLRGDVYKLVLQRFHEALSPETYLEIGVDNGETLAISRCSSIAIDPDFKLKEMSVNRKPACFFFTMTSDAFFKQYDPSVLFARKIDMAFLDGMHWFEFLLRDFINVERYCKPNSVILLHDCIPVDEYVGRRQVDNRDLKHLSSFPDWWAGDVWKVVDILLTYRADLVVHALDAAPTGLIAITGLNPTSTFLADNYFRLIAEYRDATLGEKGDEYLSKLKISETRRFGTAEQISKAFWL